MRRIATIMAGAAALTVMSGQAQALCPANTIGPLNGVGAADSGPLGGPVDAAVAEAMSPPEACAYVIEEAIPPAISEGAAATEPLPETDTLPASKRNETYVTAFVGGQPVLVDPDTRAVVEVMK
jgi:hypothetical protein